MADDRTNDRRSAYCLDGDEAGVRSCFEEARIYLEAMEAQALEDGHAAVEVIPDVERPRREVTSINDREPRYVDSAIETVTLLVRVTIVPRPAIRPSGA